MWYLLEGKGSSISCTYIFLMPFSLMRFRNTVQLMRIVDTRWPRPSKIYLHKQAITVFGNGVSKRWKTIFRSQYFEMDKNGILLLVLLLIVLSSAVTDSLEAFQRQTLLESVLNVCQVLVQLDHIEVWVHVVYRIAVVRLLKIDSGFIRQK